MYVLAVTGGVASGKSLFTEIFSGLAKENVECFDCDTSVHELLKEPEILEELRNRFGSTVFDDEGGLNRQRMGERVFASESDRKDLEGILHPRVLEKAQHELKEIGKREVKPDYLLFEVPLLYEVDFSLQRDTDVVVAASLDIQQKRLKEQRGMDDEMISQVLSAQLPMEEKISRAQQVIWNDASDTELLEEAHLLKDWIDKKVG